MNVCVVQKKQLMNSLLTEKNGTHLWRTVLDLKVRREMDFLYLPRGIDINVDPPVQMKTHFSLGSLVILPTTFYNNSTEVCDN